MWLGNSHFLQVFQLVIGCVIVLWLADLTASRTFRQISMLGVSPDRDPTSCDFTCVLWLVLWLCWRFKDVVFTISWLNNEFWLAATTFEFVLAVSGLRAFQHACFLYSKVVAGNLPVTYIKKHAGAAHIWCWKDF